MREEAVIRTPLVDSDQSSDNFVIHVDTEVAATSKVLEEVAHVHGEELRGLNWPARRYPSYPTLAASHLSKTN